MMRLSELVKIVLLAVIYFAAARFGLALDAVSGFATLVWLPSGISLAAVLLHGYHLWPGIVIGAYFANLFNNAPPLVALGIAIGNTLEALIAVYLLRRFIKFRNTLDRLQDVLGLILIAAAFSSMISATIGVLSLLVGGVINAAAFRSTWTAWWIGDMISDLIVAPPILLWANHYKLTLHFKRTLEAVCVFVIVVITGYIVFNSFFGIKIPHSAISYLVFPPLIWISFRFSQREAVSAVALLSAIAIWGTALGLGPFVRGTLNESLLFLQTFMGVTSITILIFSVIVAERKWLEQQKDNFVSIASHELNTPVTSLKAFCQVLQKHFTKAGDKTSATLLAKMDSQIDKLANLIGDLLDITKIQAGTFQFHEERFDFDALITEIIEELQRTTTKHKIVKKGSAEREIYADHKRIGQVLTNLLSNAIKYSPKESDIIVKVKSTKKIVTVCVQDFGIGISKEKQSHVFERFFREIEKKEHTFPGLGLGLHISLQIVKRYGGDIWFESKKGKGSTFCFTIPLSVNKNRVK